MKGVGVVVVPFRPRYKNHDDTTSRWPTQDKTLLDKATMAAEWISLTPALSRWEREQPFLLNAACGRNQNVGNAVPGVP
jgi:hypothetical protein